jgi:NADH-quinone oxidoreductase subunit H
MGLANVFVTAALVLLDPSLKSLAILGFVEIAFVLALTLRRKDEPAGAHGGEAHAPSPAAHGHGPADLPGAAAATHH